MAQPPNNASLLSMSTPGESNIASETPSNTTVTLATPDPVHVPLASLESHNPPRFIFYPISWDGSEDPATQNKKTTPSSDVHTDYVDDDQPNSSSAVFCFTDTFWSIDRWRRHVVECDDAAAADLLDPIYDVETLLSFPHDDYGGSRNMTEKPPHRMDGSGSEVDVPQYTHR